MSTHMRTHMSTHMRTHMSTHMPKHMSTRMSTHMSTHYARPCTRRAVAVVAVALEACMGLVFLELAYNGSAHPTTAVRDLRRAAGAFHAAMHGYIILILGLVGVTEARRRRRRFFIVGWNAMCAALGQLLLAAGDVTARQPGIAEPVAATDGSLVVVLTEAATFGLMVLLPALTLVGWCARACLLTHVDMLTFPHAYTHVCAHICRCPSAYLAHAYFAPGWFGFDFLLVPEPAADRLVTYPHTCLSTSECAHLHTCLHTRASACLCTACRSQGSAKCLQPCTDHGYRAWHAECLCCRRQTGRSRRAPTVAMGHGRCHVARGTCACMQARTRTRARARTHALSLGKPLPRAADLRTAAPRLELAYRRRVRTLLDGFCPTCCGTPRSVHHHGRVGCAGVSRPLLCGVCIGPINGLRLAGISVHVC